MKLSDNLKTLRNSRALSQKDLAEALGFSFQSISKWERDESLPDIVTLIKIAEFFSTTTDSLLGFSPEEKFLSQFIDKAEADIYAAYPSDETNITEKIVISVDAENRIYGIFFMPPNRPFKYYQRNSSDPFCEESTIIYENFYNHFSKKIVDNKKLRIPENGFLIAVSDNNFAAKKIMNFIIPEEYSDFLDSHVYPGYYDNQSGRSLFGDILKRGELDGISVELSDNGILLKKQAENVDPMSVNIEALTKIVRKELRKEHDKQIRQLQARIDELEAMVSDNECSIEELDERVSEIESKFSEED
ncbi:MAG: helix-turn-helix domain-containing protein [Clostridia bacterium]|nr:helix-turn-helix domain-containing protein [Clostridia bacterium]